MSIRIELLYEPDCPNVPKARDNLRAALSACRLAPAWDELSLADPATRANHASRGSPTILVDGADVAGPDAAEAAACRIYRDADGALAGAPAAADIAKAIRARLATTGAEAADHRATTPHDPPLAPAPTTGLATVLPGLGAAAVLVPTCGACVPAVASLLGAAGLGILLSEPALIALTLTALGVAVTALAFQVRTIGTPAPLVLASGGAVLAAAAALGSASRATASGARAGPPRGGGGGTPP